MAERERGLVEHLLGLLLAQARDHALIVLDPEGVVVAWLAGSENIFGYTADEIIGHTLHPLFTPEDIERGVPEHELQVARVAGRGEDDRWQVRKDGTRIWASGVVTPLCDADARLVGYGKVLRDRTDVRGQLVSAENRAESLVEADARKNLFLGTLAHELRNPLVPLTNAVELIRRSESADSDPIRYALSVIDRQVAFLDRLVADLLDTTRIDAGKMVLDCHPLELSEVMQRAAESCRPLAERRHQDLQVLPLPSPMIIYGDADRLHQVFVNLLNNAIKYTPEQGHVWFKATTEGSQAVVRVEDTGIGIGAETLPRIFELFTQEESARRMAPGGLGLGLPLVRQLVTLHGGSVQVRSEGLNRGAEFTVRLPLHRTLGRPVSRETPETD